MQAQNQHTIPKVHWLCSVLIETVANPHSKSWSPLRQHLKHMSCSRILPEGVCWVCANPKQSRVARDIRASCNVL